MYKYTDAAAFVLRLAIFFLLFSTYPLVNFFLKNILLNLFYRNKPTTKLIDLTMNLSMTLIPLLFALFYPNIGTILSYASAVSGLLIIYVFPVMVHLKQMKSRIMHPLLAEALETNEYKVVVDQTGMASPKIEVSDRLAKSGIKRKQGTKAEREAEKKKQWRAYYISCALHSFIPVYGILIVFFQFGSALIFPP
jgi:hypothetical protein